MRTSLTLVLVLAGTAPFAQARTGQAHVQEQQGNPGTPCFTITQAEEERSGAPNFASVKVIDVHGSSRVMWTMAMPAERTFPVSYRMCIPYAGRLPVLPQTKALALREGRLYEVIIVSRKGKPKQAAPSYRARFCLVKQADAAPQVRVIDAASRRGCGT
jgi:hypothetical protein